MPPGAHALGSRGALREVARGMDLKNVKEERLLGGSWLTTT
jgi:hypothetical protein